MSKAFESIKRGLRQAIGHSLGKRVRGLEGHHPHDVDVKGQERTGLKSIRSKADHRAALEEITTLMNAKPGTPEGERLDVLATLVEAYERKHFLTDLRDPVAASRVRRRAAKRGGP